MKKQIITTVNIDQETLEILERLKAEGMNVSAVFRMVMKEKYGKKETV